MLKILDNLTKRVAWSIEIIKIERSLDKGIRDIDLAKILGTNKNTLSDYRKEKGLLKGVVVENLVSAYNFDPVWFYKGIGEPFPGAKEKYPDVCGPEEISRKTIDKNGPLYNKVESDEDPGISQDEKEYDPHGGWQPRDIHESVGVDKGLGIIRAIERLSKIYASKMPSLINAINVNLEAFCEAVDRREGEIEAVAQVKKLNLRVDTLEKQLNNLVNSNRRKGERRSEDLGPPDGLDRRTGSERRKHAIGE